MSKQFKITIIILTIFLALFLIYFLSLLGVVDFIKLKEEMFPTYYSEKFENEGWSCKTVRDIEEKNGNIVIIAECDCGKLLFNCKIAGYFEDSEFRDFKNVEAKSLQYNNTLEMYEDKNGFYNFQSFTNNKSIYI
ncbi:MAG: hypothetical protein WCK26_04130, partial [Candidatus Saccharibacteria bacterium]